MIVFSFSGWHVIYQTIGTLCWWCCAQIASFHCAANCCWLKWKWWFTAAWFRFQSWRSSIVTHKTSIFFFLSLAERYGHWLAGNDQSMRSIAWNLCNHICLLWVWRASGHGIRWNQYRHWAAEMVFVAAKNTKNVTEHSHCCSRANWLHHSW